MKSYFPKKLNGPPTSGIQLDSGKNQPNQTIKYRLLIYAREGGENPEHPAALVTSLYANVPRVLIFRHIWWENSAQWKTTARKNRELKSESFPPGETIKTPSIQRTGKGANQDVIITTPITTKRPNRHHHEREKVWVNECGELSLSFAVGSREQQPQSMGYGGNRLLSLLLIGYEIAQWLAAVIMAAQMQLPHSVAETIEHLKLLFFWVHARVW